MASICSKCKGVTEKATDGGLDFGHFMDCPVVDEWFEKGGKIPVALRAHGEEIPNVEGGGEGGEPDAEPPVPTIHDEDQSLTWDYIPGYFEFADVYADAVKEAKHGDHFVEVGCYYGRSVAYLATRARDAGKQIKIDAIDNFKHPYFRAQAKTFRLFMKNCGFSGVVKLVELDQIAAAKLYDDASLDFVFLDADHGYVETQAAILAFLPKIKPGGVLAGDDYAPEFPGVVIAVDELLPGREVKGRAFHFRLPLPTFSSSLLPSSSR